MLPHWTQNDIQTNGTKLHYYRSGNTNKPALVLAHGFSDDGLCWLQTAIDLEADYDVVMPDARGHGLSERLKPGETVDAAEDLAELIQALALPPAVVAGHSMGAATAFQLAARFPHLVRALILEDPPWFQQPPDASGEGKTPPQSPMQGWVDTIQRQSLEEIVAQCRQDHPTWDEVVVQTWCGAKKRLDKSFLTAQRPPLFAWQAAIPAIACPTLLVTADVELGGMVTPQLAEWVSMTNANFKLAHIPGVGHHVRFGAYDAYMQSVREFLYDLESVGQ
jgi:pimeloyl-ACP methyl ester carboxylesterase